MEKRGGGEGGCFELVFQLHPIAGLTGINECGWSVYSDGASVCIDADGGRVVVHTLRVFAWHYQIIPTPNNTTATSFSALLFPLSSFSPSLPPSLAHYYD